MYKFDIKIPIYDCVCHVIISSDIEKVINKYSKRLKWSEDTLVAEGQKVDGYYVRSGMKNYYIFYKLEESNVNTLVHEISHLIDGILGDRDIESNGEAKAYLTGYISEHIFDYVMKKKLLVNKWFSKVQVADINKNQKVKDEESSGLL